MTRPALASLLRAGDLLVPGSGVGEPQQLLRELDAHRSGLPEVGLFAGISYTNVITAELAAATRLSSFGAMGTISKLAAQGLVDVLPVHYVDVARHLRVRGGDGLVLLLQLAPADEDGCHSLGPAVDYTAELIDDARLVIAEINDELAPVPGPRIPASRIDLSVPVSRPLIEVPSGAIEELHKDIAGHLLPLIPDAAVLQLGIGGVPSAVAALLARERSGLRVYTGLAGDWLLDLDRAGALEPGAPIVVGGAAGSAALYRFLAEDARVEVRRIADLTRPELTAVLPRLVAINSAVQVDLSGQVNAEVAGTRYVGGIGGQVDSLRGAQLSEGGRSIVAISATAGGGKHSRVVARLDLGTVTTGRSGVDFIVSEFGLADLRGKGLRDRATAIAAIAAPEFRDELLTAAQAH